MGSALGGGGGGGDQRGGHRWRSRLGLAQRRSEPGGSCPACAACFLCPPSAYPPTSRVVSLSASVPILHVFAPFCPPNRLPSSSRSSQVITSEIDEYIDVDFRVVPGVGNVSPSSSVQGPGGRACKHGSDACALAAHTPLHPLIALPSPPAAPSVRPAVWRSLLRRVSRQQCNADGRHQHQNLIGTLCSPSASCPSRRLPPPS